MLDAFSLKHTISQHNLPFPSLSCRSHTGRLLPEARHLTPPPADPPILCGPVWCFLGPWCTSSLIFIALGARPLPAQGKLAGAPHAGRTYGAGGGGGARCVWGVCAAALPLIEGGLWCSVGKEVEGPVLPCDTVPDYEALCCCTKF